MDSIVNIGNSNNSSNIENNTYMTPQHKAVYLVSKFKHSEDREGYRDVRDIKAAIRCALIAVKEIIIQWDYIDTYLGNGNGELNPNLEYWYKVEEELNNLSQ